MELNENKNESNVNMEALAEAEKLKAQFLNGISWFYWIGGLSIVNIFMGFAGRKFIFGLGVTEIVDSLATSGNETSIPLLLVSAGISLVFIWLGYKGRSGNASLIMAGLVFYGLDAALLVVESDWLSVLFHAFAGYSIFKGYQALKQITVRVPA